ncbi:MAG: hypothetical protein IH613_04640 [Desulfuromonadales bacterium]|nr:hypothetical protein [Desulfuromonadales bacterium]
MNKAGLWPREKPRPTDSSAEIRLYEAFTGELPVRDGRWYQNNNSLDHSPREQVHFFVKKPASRLPSVNIFTVRCSHNIPDSATGRGC